LILSQSSRIPGTRTELPQFPFLRSPAFAIGIHFPRIFSAHITIPEERHGQPQPFDLTNGQPQPFDLTIEAFFLILHFLHGCAFWPQRHHVLSPIFVLTLRRPIPRTACLTPENETSIIITLEKPKKKKKSRKFAYPLAINHFVGGHKAIQSSHIAHL